MAWLARGCQCAARQWPPSLQAQPQCVAGVVMQATPIRLHNLVRCPAAHPHDDRARQDGVGQVTEAGHRDSAISRDFLGEDLLAPNDAATGDAVPTMAGVQQPANFFVVVLRPRPEHGVDFVEQDRRPAVL